MQDTTTRRRRGGRDARLAAVDTTPRKKAIGPGLEGGAYRPLGEHDIERIHKTALDVLETIGVGNPIPEVAEPALARGCHINQHGRLCFPRALIEDIIAGAARQFVLYGRERKHDLDVGGTRTHFATSGDAVTVLDMETGRYRPSTVTDLYDLVRLVDRLDNIHAFGQMVIPTDIKDVLVQEINVVYAITAGTTKHFSLSMEAGNVDDAVALGDMVLGGDGRYREKPFFTVSGCPIVSPLRFVDENCRLMLAAARAGASCNPIVAAQAGGTAPAALAGALVQTVAETLTCLAMINFVNPGHPVIFSNWPFVTDLRTGSFSGGGGEEALLNAASAQIGRFYDLPRCVAAGMTDAKLPDNQAGYEKGVATALAGLAGANLVYESAGMLGSLMGCAFESLVIDNDMLGAVQRAVRGIEVTDETLSFDVIRDTVLGPRHYLGHRQTLALMDSEYVYPEVGDRTTQNAWEAAGSPDVREHARARAREILSSHYPRSIDAATDEALRARFPIRLAREAMGPEGGAGEPLHHQGNSISLCVNRGRIETGPPRN